jgi:hypothetical protein
MRVAARGAVGPRTVRAFACASTKCRGTRRMFRVFQQGGTVAGLSLVPGTVRLIPGDVPIRLDEDDDFIERVIFLVNPDDGTSTARSTCPEAPSSTVQKRDCAGIKGAGLHSHEDQTISSYEHILLLKARRPLFCKVAASIQSSQELPQQVARDNITEASCPPSERQ